MHLFDIFALWIIVGCTLVAVLPASESEDERNLPHVIWLSLFLFSALIWPLYFLTWLAISGEEPDG